MQLIETRQMGKLGRVGIPERVRKAFGLEHGDNVDIYLDGNHIVLIKPGLDAEKSLDIGGCPLCGDPNPTIRVSAIGKDLCQKCVNDIRIATEPKRR